MKLILLIPCLILFGCGKPAKPQPQPNPTTNRTAALPPMPPAPRTNFSGKTFSGKVAKALTPTTITLEWNNYGVMSNVTTGIEGAVMDGENLVWVELTNMPAAPTSRVTLSITNDSPGMAYRAFNRYGGAKKTIIIK